MDTQDNPKPEEQKPAPQVRDLEPTKDAVGGGGGGKSKSSAFGGSSGGGGGSGGGKGGKNKNRN